MRSFFYVGFLVKKKFLIVSALQVFPPESGGQLRTSTLAKTLVSLGHEVEVFSLTGRKADYLHNLKSGVVYRQNGLLEYVYRGKIFGLLQFFSYRLKIAPFWVIWIAPFFKPKMFKQSLEQADHVILDFPYLYKLTQRSFILNTHNAEYELYPEDSLQRKLVKKYEIKALSLAKKVLFCHQADQKKFKEIEAILEPKSLVVPNGVDLQDFVYNKAVRVSVREQLGIGQNQTVFLFTGSQYGPNVEAFEFLKKFVAENLETMQTHGLVILVAGTVCREKMATPNFKVLGRVEKMSDYFWASDFGINPVEMGSGTNVKMIEFLAAKLPILCCEFGARGLELADSQEAYIFERNTLLTKLIEASRSDLQHRQQMAMAALAKNIKKVEMKEALLDL